MNVIETPLPGVLLIEPRVFKDPRGFFKETFHSARYTDHLSEKDFVQDNHSRSSQNIVRGLHYQLQNPQAKLVFVVRGSIFDVAVDIRRGSPTFGQWFGTELSESNHRQIYIPEGFAHGFSVTSEVADVIYKCSDVYHPGDEYGVLWSDPGIGVDWPLNGDPIISEKDAQFSPLAEMLEASLPEF